MEEVHVEKAMWRGKSTVERLMNAGTQKDV
jgi:hypothetical protein